jgi:hypothetical protein
VARTPPDDTTQPPAWTGPVRDPSPVVQWIGWHLAELAGVTAPLVLAVTVDVWWAALSVSVATAWLAHELRTRRQVRALAAARDRRTVTEKPSGKDPEDRQMEASA